MENDFLKKRTERDYNKVLEECDESIVYNPAFEEQFHKCIEAFADQMYMVEYYEKNILVKKNDLDDTDTIDWFCIYCDENENLTVHHLIKTIKDIPGSDNKVLDSTEHISSYNEYGYLIAVTDFTNHVDGLTETNLPFVEGMDFVLCDIESVRTIPPSYLNGHITQRTIEGDFFGMMRLINFDVSNRCHYGNLQEEYYEIEKLSKDELVPGKLLVTCDNDKQEYIVNEEQGESLKEVQEKATEKFKKTIEPLKSECPLFHNYLSMKMITKNK